MTIELTALGAARWACAAACVFEYARACVAALDAEPARVGAVGAELAAVAELGFDYAGEDEADELVEELAKLMLPMYGIPRASLLRARHECREAAVGPEALAVLEAVADPGACRVELLDSALAADDAAEPAAPCPGCPRCSGRAGFHAALDALAKKGRRSCAPVDAPPPPPPDAWTPYGALATARPAEPPATEPRFGTEYWASPVPAPLVDLWRTSRAWPGLGVPAANPFVGSAPALAGAGVAPRAAPDAAEAAAVAAAADACAAFAAGWKGARGAAAAPAKGKKKRKPPTGDAPARKLAGDAFPRPRDVDAAPARLESDGRVWVAPRAARFELPRLEICVRLAAPLPPAADGAAVATHLALTALCAALLRDAVAEDLYAATVAHLFYSVSSSSGELVLRCGGVVSDAVPRLADALVDGLAGLAAAEPGAGPWAPGPRFDAAVSALRRDLGNSWHEDPAKHARKLRLCALVPGRNRPPGVRRAALDGAAPADARAHLRAFLAGAKWDALVHGNVADGGEAVRAALAPKLDALAGGGAGAAAAVSPPRVLRLRRGATAYVTEPSEDPGCATSAVEIYYQLGPDQRPAAATIFRERVRPGKRRNVALGRPGLRGVARPREPPRGRARGAPLRPAPHEGAARLHRVLRLQVDRRRRRLRDQRDVRRLAPGPRRRPRRRVPQGAPQGRHEPGLHRRVRRPVLLARGPRQREAPVAVGPRGPPLGRDRRPLPGPLRRRRRRRAPRRGAHARGPPRDLRPRLRPRQLRGRRRVRQARRPRRRPRRVLRRRPRAGGRVRRVRRRRRRRRGNRLVAAAGRGARPRRRRARDARGRVLAGARFRGMGRGAAVLSAIHQIKNAQFNFKYMWPHRVTVLSVSTLTLIENVMTASSPCSMRSSSTSASSIRSSNPQESHRPLMCPSS